MARSLLFMVVGVVLAVCFGVLCMQSNGGASTTGNAEPAEESPAQPQAKPAAKAPSSETAAGEAVSSKAAGDQTSPEEHVPPPSDGGFGVCRAFGRPTGLDTRGLEVKGAFAGELQGEVMGSETTYLAALTACIADAECDGVTSSWYVGAPWVAMRDSAPFRPNEDSYGCTVTVGGRP